MGQEEILKWKKKEWNKTKEKKTEEKSYEIVVV